MRSGMSETNLSLALFGEIIAMDHIAKAAMSRALPKGMEISHFALLNYLHTLSGDERSPGQLAKSFSVTKGAMTNTLNKLEVAGYVAIRPAWEDARRKMVAISPAGNRAREQALASIEPLAAEIQGKLGEGEMKQMLSDFRKLREALTEQI